MKRYIAVLSGICACGVVGCLELNTTTDGAGGEGWGSGSSSSTDASSSSGMSSSGMSSSGVSSGGMSSSSGASSASSSSGGPTEYCGNGVIDPAEDCDDANAQDGDGCSSNCLFEKTSSVFIGTPGQSGNTDGIGQSALLSNTAVLAIYGSNLYIGAGTSVRVANTQTKVVTTIAGTAALTGKADAPVGTDARFNNINGLATDGNTLWVADTGNSLLRAISLTAPYGVTTVAGSGTFGYADGIGTNARFDYIRGIAYYNGIVYIIDSNIGLLRSFDPLTGEVKTLAGAPSMSGVVDGVGSDARFTNPRHISSDGTGRLFIADIGGASIRQYDVASNMVTTVAGNGTCGYVDGSGFSSYLYRPRGAAYDGKSIFWVEAIVNTVRKVSLETGNVFTISGSPDTCATDCSCPANGLGGYVEGVGSTARWNNPYDIVYHSASKSFFISDAGNYVIRRLQ